MEKATKKQMVNSGFGIFGFKKKVLDGIREVGFREPSPIQKEVIPIILDGLDVIAQAQTGTGKTAAFALPLVNWIKTQWKY